MCLQNVICLRGSVSCDILPKGMGMGHRQCLPFTFGPLLLHVLEGNWRPLPTPYSHNGSCRCLSALSWQSIDQSKFQVAMLPPCYHARDINRYSWIKVPIQLHYWCSLLCIVRCQLRQTNIVLPMRNSIKKSQNLKVIFLAVSGPKNLCRFEWQPIIKYYYYEIWIEFMHWHVKKDYF